MHYLATAVRILLLLVCATPLVYANTFYPFVVPKALYARTLIEVAFVAWVVVAACSPEHRPHRSWIMVALFAWLGASVLAAMFGVSPVRSVWSSYTRMGGIVDLAHWCVYALMLASMFHTAGRWRQLLAVNAAVSGVVALVGILGHLLPSGAWFLQFDGRPGSTLGNGLFLGAYACISVGLTTTLMMSVDANRKVAVILTAVVALNLVVVWLSASRSALLVVFMMAAAFAVAWAFLDRRLWARYTALAGLAVGLCIALALGALIATGLVRDLPGEMGKRLTVIATPKDYANSGRIMAATAAVDAYQDRPVWGYGPENFEAAWGRHYRAEWSSHQTFDNAHNKFLEVAATTGTVGIVVYGTLCLLILGYAVTALRQQTGHDRMVTLAMAVTSAGYFALCMVMLDTPVFLMLFSILVGYWAYLESSRREPLWQRSAVALRSWAARAIAAAGAGLLIYSIVQINLQMLSGAQVTQHPPSLREFVENEQRIMENFPPMANERRLLLASVAATAVAEGAAYPPAVINEIEAGLAVEPYNWRLPFAAAYLHQVAAAQDPLHIGEARRYLDKLERIAPESQYTGLLRESQEALEEHYAQWSTEQQERNSP